jgi:hypothetical protein
MHLSSTVSGRPSQPLLLSSQLHHIVPPLFNTPFGILAASSAEHGAVGIESAARNGFIHSFPIFTVNVIAYPRFFSHIRDGVPDRQDTPALSNSDILPSATPTSPSWLSTC